MDEDGNGENGIIMLKRLMGERGEISKRADVISERGMIIRKCNQIEERKGL